MIIQKKAKAFFLSVIAVSIVMATAFASERYSSETKAPEMILKSPSGELIPLTAYLGKKPVLLVFWASWCAICRDEVPHLKKLNADRFKVVAVNEGESAWKTKRFIAMNDIDYQVVLDSDGAVAKALQVPGVPACAIINKSGLIVYRGMGLPDNIDAYAGK